MFPHNRIFVSLRLLVSASALMAGFIAETTAAANDIAPPPRRSPREPVSQQSLMERKSALPPSRSVSGKAVVVDTERLRIGDTEIRLFGVVPPQLSAPYGPQARAVLDTMAATGTITCSIHDRDRESRLLANCRGTEGGDPALELLKRGLAVTARGSLRSSELAPAYEAAERAAQAQKVGLWSLAIPQSASGASIKEAMAETASSTAQMQTQTQTQPPQAQQSQSPPSSTPPTAEPPAAKEADKPETSSAIVQNEKPKKGSNAESSAALSALADQAIRYELPMAAQVTPQAAGWAERYQLLIASILALMAALCFTSASFLRNVWNRREDVRSIASALRGELMAARSVCSARLRQIEREADEKSVGWPRIRTLVFQAYVGKLGLLGAEMSRKIASIYGQASDYASYYQTQSAPAPSSPTQDQSASKRQSLAALIQHMDEVMPRLAAIEEGKRFGCKSPLSNIATASANCNHTSSDPQPPSPRSKNKEKEESETLAQDSPATEQPKAESAPIASAPQSSHSPSSNIPTLAATTISTMASSEKAEAPVAESSSAKLDKSAVAPAAPSAPAPQQPESPEQSVVVATEETVAEPEEAINSATAFRSKPSHLASILPLFGRIKDFAISHLERDRSDPADSVPDYVTMSDEEMEKYLQEAKSFTEESHRKTAHGLRFR